MDRRNGKIAVVDALIAKHRPAILRAAARHGAGNVRVFGSAARGTVGPSSDVDFLVDVVGPVTPWFPGGLMSELEDLLGRKVDIATEKELDCSIRDQVLKEAVAL